MIKEFLGMLYILFAMMFFAICILGAIWAVVWTISILPWPS